MPRQHYPDEFIGPRVTPAQMAVIRAKRWREQNRERSNELSRLGVARNPERRARTLRKYYDKHREKNNARSCTAIKQRLKTDPSFRRMHKLREKVNRTLRYGQKGEGKKFQWLVGCTAEQFRKHIESKFKPGMHWGNRHKTKGWVIDHIKPCKLFDFTDPAHQQECFHYTNTQPLWASENNKKRDKYVDLTRENFGNSTCARKAA